MMATVIGDHWAATGLGGLGGGLGQLLANPALVDLIKLAEQRRPKMQLVEFTEGDVTAYREKRCHEARMAGLGARARYGTAAAMAAAMGWPVTTIPGADIQRRGRQPADPEAVRFFGLCESDRAAGTSMLWIRGGLCPGAVSHITGHEAYHALDRDAGEDECDTFSRALCGQGADWCGWCAACRSGIVDRASEPATGGAAARPRSGMAACTVTGG